MKKKAFLLVAIALAFIFLVACSNNPSAVSGGADQKVVFADQNAFLDAMAKGIQNRLDKVDDAAHANDTAEQMALYDRELVNCELDQIGKYETAVFEDSTFNELAHLYIAACKMQQSSTNYTRNNDLSDSLFSAGYTARSAIITMFYQQYNLPVTSEIANQYAPSSGNITFSISPDTDDASSAKPEATPEPVIDPAQFEVKEYSYVSYGNTYYYLVIKNNSDVTVKINSNAIAYDASGNVIGADDLDEIQALAPGEETISYFYFSKVEGIKKVEYQLDFSSKLYYRPVISNLSAQVHVNDKNVIVQAKNNGDYSVQFVKAFVLFFDKAGNLVDADYQYLTDGDSEIKPGATQSGQIDTRKEFDHISVYFNGRG